MAVLEMKEIFYAYEKGRPVLSNVNTQFDAGKMYAILGPSGSGKTTLLSLIGGLDTPQKVKSSLRVEIFHSAGLPIIGEIMSH